MSLSEFLSAMTSNAGILQNFVISLFANVIGWYVLGTGGVRLVKWGSPRRDYGASSIMVRTVIGTLFIQATPYLNMAATTVTGYGLSTSNAMSVMPSGGNATVAAIFAAVLAWMAVLGVIAMLHGAQLLIKAGDGSGNQATDSDPKWTGCVFIFSGAIGVNLWRFVGGVI
jgi:hypothetical protein